MLRLPEVSVEGGDVVLDLAAYDRWGIPRELLMEEVPADRLSPEEGRLVGEWPNCSRSGTFDRSSLRSSIVAGAGNPRHGGGS